MGCGEEVAWVDGLWVGVVALVEEEDGVIRDRRDHYAEERRWAG